MEARAKEEDAQAAWEGVVKHFIDDVNSKQGAGGKGDLIGIAGAAEADADMTAKYSPLFTSAEASC
eukprot:12574547-Alexandrium_andersonii.AAC.1